MEGIVKRLSSFFLLVFIVSIADVFAQEGSSDNALDIQHQKIFEIIDQVNSGNEQFFLDALDYEEFLRRATEGISIKLFSGESEVDGFKKTIRENFLPVLRTGYLHYVNYSEDEDTYEILVRLDNDTGIIYWELLLERRDPNEVVIVDIYPYVSGDYMSETMKRAFQIIEIENTGINKLLSNLSIKEKAYSESVTKLPVLKGHIEKQEYSKAREVYESLPEFSKNDKLFILIILQAAQGLSDDYYIEIIERYKQHYPDDPNLPLLSIDYHLLKGEITEAIARVDELDDIIGGDNYLQAFRGNVYLIGNDTTNARISFEKALNEDEWLEDAYSGLLELHLITKEFDKVVVKMNELESRFDYEFTPDIFQEATYDEFRASDAYKKWLLTR